MANRALERLAGKALLDAEFRAWLLKDPKAAASSVAVDLTEEQVERIQQVDREALEKLVQEFQELAHFKEYGPW